MSPAAAKLLVWNAQWARPNSARGEATIALLGSLHADVMCVTEAHVDLVPAGGHSVNSSPNYGYVAPAWRRKVVLWSRTPWRTVDLGERTDMPTGRYVAATTETPAGTLRIARICIPWRAAHVSTGRSDRQPWEDHLAFIDGLAELLDETDGPDVVLGGDFNQQLPPTRQPRRVSERLRGCLAGWTIATEGQPGGHAVFDHIALRPPLAVSSVRMVAASQGSHRLTDHEFGAAVDVISRAW